MVIGDAYFDPQAASAECAVGFLWWQESRKPYIKYKKDVSAVAKKYASFRMEAPRCLPQQYKIWGQDMYL